jgi:hypothetical protein
LKITARVLCVLMILAALGHAQDESALTSKAVESPAPVPAEASPAPASVLQDLFAPTTFSRTLTAALTDQIRRFPEQWGHGMTHGFGARAASEYGQVAMENLIETGVQAWHKEDPRYFRRGHGNFFRRTYHVIENTVVVHSTEGGRTVSLAMPASAYGSWAIAARWYPSDLHGVGSFLQYGSSNVGMKAAGNFIREFWPDVKGIFRRSPETPLHTGSD